MFFERSILAPLAIVPESVLPYFNGPSRSTIASLCPDVPSSAKAKGKSLHVTKKRMRKILYDYFWNNTINQDITTLLYKIDHIFSEKIQNYLYKTEMIKNPKYYLL